MPDKIDALYDALKADGAVTKSREHFREYISDDNNRRQLYEALKADGAIQSSNFTEFDNRLGYGSATAPTTAYRAKAAPPQVKAPAKAPKKQSGGSRLSRATAKAGEAPRYDVFGWAKGTMAKIKQARREKNEGNFLGRIMNKVEDAKEAGRRKAAQAQAQKKPKQVTAEQATADLWNTVARGNAMMGGLHDRAEAIKEYQRQGWRDKSGRVATVGGVHSDVRKGKSRFNPETGKMEERWITPTGEVYGSEHEADANMLDDNISEQEVRDQMKDLAYNVKKKLNERGLELDAEALSSNIGDRPMGTGGAVHTFNSSTVNGRFVDPQYKALFAANSILLDVNRMIQEADHNAQKGTFGKWLEQSFGAGVSRGLSDKLFDPRTWDMGITDITEATSLKDAIDTYEKGKELTEAQQMLLDAKAIEMAANAYFASRVGKGYKAGSMTAEALPFMLEFLANPAAASGRGIQSSLLRYALKRFTKKGALKELKRKGLTGVKDAFKTLGKKETMKVVGGRVAGDIAGASLMAGTSGLPKVGAGTVERMIGEPTLGRKEDGKLTMVGSTKKKGAGQAFKEAFSAATIENLSEMVGEYFAPVFGTVGKVVGKGLDKIKLGKINDLISRMSASDIVRGFDNFLDKTQWHGPFGEFSEEIVGGIGNAWLVGDQTLDTDPETGVFNGQNLIDTALGVSLMGGIISTLKTGSYFSSRKTAKRRLDFADRRCQQQMGTDWGAISASLTGTDEQIQQVLSDVMKSTDYNQQQKQAVLNYAYALQNAKGVEVGAEKLKAEMTPEQVAEQDAEEQGYNTEDDAEMRTNKLRYDNAVEQLQQSGLDMSEVEAMAADGSIYRVLGMNTFDEAQTNAVKEWLMARASYNGMISRVQDDIDDEVATAQQEVEARIAKQDQGGDGMIHPAVLKLGDRQVDIVGGNVVMHEEDGSIDTNKSDKDLLVRDTQTGKVEMVNINDLARAEAPIDAQQLLAETRANIENARANEVGDKIDGTVQVGGTYTITDAEQKQHTVTVLEDNGDGNLVVQEEGGEPFAMNREQLQSLVDASARQQLAAQQAADNAQLTMQNAQSDAANEEQSPRSAAASEEIVSDLNAPMPTKEVNGKQRVDYNRATPERAAHHIYNEKGYSEEEADEMVANTIAAKQKALEEKAKALDEANAEVTALEGVRPTTPLTEETEDEYNAEKAEIEARRSEAQARAQQANQELEQALQEVTHWWTIRDAASQLGENAQSTMQNAQSSMDNAQLTMHNAQLEQPVEETPAQTEQSEQPAQQSEQPTASEEQPTANEEQPAASEEAPQVDSEAAAATKRNRERIEKVRAKIKAKVEKLAEACAIPSHVIESEDDLDKYPKRISNAVRAQLKQGKRVRGFYDPKSGHMYYYMPGLLSEKDADETFAHETVAHGGLRLLLNDQAAFDELCDNVWNLMSVEDQARYMNYVGVKSLEDMTQENKRAAADEYMAHLSDGQQQNSTSTVKKVLRAISEMIQKVFKKRGINLDIKSDEDIMALLKASRRNLSEVDKEAIKEEIGDALESEDGSDSGRVLMSTVSIFDGAGFEAEQIDENGNSVPMTDAEGNMVVKMGGKEFSAKNPIKASDLNVKAGEETSVLQMLVNDAKEVNNLSEKRAKKIYQNYADILNMYLRMGSAEMGGPDAVERNWQWLGETVYRTIAANGDAQYSYSMDIIKVCKKNEAVIKAMSAHQLLSGRGATPSEIVEIYRKTYSEGYQVPCPVCYVFTRYIRNGKYASAAIRGMETYGEHLPGGSDVWTVKQWLDELDRLNRLTNSKYEPKGKESEEEKEARVKEAKRYENALADANEITVVYEKRINALSYELTRGVSKEREKEIMDEIKVMDARYQGAIDVISFQALTNWIKTFAIEEKSKKWKLRDDAKKPEDMNDFRANALDLRLTANTMVNYPAIQRLRKSGGSAAGKEITFASNNELGEVVSGLGINKTNLGLYANPYQQFLAATDPKEKAKLRKKAQERFKDASVYAAMQTLRGGQRMWSWSDNIERLSPDIAINLIQLELLDGAMQTYSKQLEGVKLTAQMGAYVNGSLMAKDNGWLEVSKDEVYERDGQLWLKEDKTETVEEPQVGGEVVPRERVYAGKGSHVYQAKDGKLYVLQYDDVIGIDPFGNRTIKDKDGNDKKAKGLFELNDELDKAGNILVGMNDLHIRAALADPRVFFVIPWHSSGANNHILAEMFAILGQRIDSSVDYQSMQEEKNMGSRDKDSKKLPAVTQRLRDLWNEGKKWAKENGWTSGMDVDSDGDLLTEDQYMYRQLRSLIFNGTIFEEMPSEEKYNEAVETYESLDEQITAWENQKDGADAETKKWLDKQIEKARPKRNAAQHIIELHDGLIDWRDSDVNKNDEHWQRHHPKRINVEEARAMVLEDEFLKQVYGRVEPIGHMTNGDNTYIYPYEYWDESSTYDTADINGKRYVEYCRRMGYKPKFSGDWKTKDESKQNVGNFVHDPGYWKLLIDRRMYDRAGKYQWLDPVSSEDFNTDLINPEETKHEFHVTTVADDAAADSIASKVFEEEKKRTPSGFAYAQYTKPMDQVLDDFEDAMAGNVRFSTVAAPVFYSNAEKAVEGIKQNKATAEQWKAMLTKAGGIKAGEDKWMGLSDWLDENKGKSLTKDEVLQFVRDNGIQMEEVEYGEVEKDSPRLKELDSEYHEAWTNVDGIFEKAAKAFADYVNQMEAKYGDKYYSQMTPQEKQKYNRLSIDQELRDPYIYDKDTIAMREMVDRYGDDFELAFRGVDGELYVDDENAASHIVGGENIINETRLQYTTYGLNNKREIALVVPNVEGYQEGDEVHFGPENQGKAVMWVRFGETTDADGKRVLVIDEIQSNRHQDAREKGYKVDEKTAFAEYKKAIADYKAASKRNDTEAMKEAEKRYNLYGAIAGQLPGGRESIPASVRDAVPAAPFEKNWHEVAMKRMLRLAAEEGFDKVAWTTGEQQAARYDIGDAVNGIYYGDWESTGENDVKRVEISFKESAFGPWLEVDREGKVVQSLADGAQFVGHNLQEILGKDIAGKILADGSGDIEREGLRIGGDGMKGFYDQMLPRFMDKYGKKWGVKTGTVELPNVEEAGRRMHSVDVTPEMRESVMQGQLLFSTKSTNESLGAPWQGSKGRHAMRLIEKLPGGKRFVDLFAGGGAMTHGAIVSGKYDSYLMNDVNPLGMEMFMQGARGDWDNYDRESMTPEEFAQVKGTPEGMVWSYGGLGRNVDRSGVNARRAINRMKRLGELKPEAGKIATKVGSYKNVKLKQGDVVYADLPYEGTDTRGYGNGSSFDKAAFNEWAQKQNVPVFVSETTMPEGWTEIDAFSASSLRGKRTEKLWVQDKFAGEYETSSRNTEQEADGGLRFSRSGRDIAIDDLVGQYDYLFSDNYVDSIKGDEFIKNETPLDKRVEEYYKTNYNGYVDREGFGRVILDRRSVKNSLSHGIGREKAAAFVAVPSIIRDGVIIDEKDKYKGRNQKSFVIAAPIEIAQKGFVGFVVVVRGEGTNSNKFYLHEVALQKSLQNESFKTGNKADSHNGDLAKVIRNIMIAKENAEKNKNNVSSVEIDPRVIYTANNVVDPEALEKKYPSELPNKYYDHSTNKFGKQPYDNREGTKETLKITGRLTTDKVDVLVVDNPNSDNEIPHITLATAEGVKPFESNAELKKHRNEIVPLNDTVETIIHNNLREKGGVMMSTVDSDYMAAVEAGDIAKAEQMVKAAAKDAGMATDESGNLIDLYHGTNRFGFTVFDRLKSRMGVFFTSNKSNVAANYGGDDHYAGKRKINKGYKQDDSQEGILNNARSVFDQDWNMATEGQKEAIVTKAEADARRIVDEIDKRRVDTTNLPADEELDIFNATAWVEDLFNTVAYAKENGNEGAELYRLVSDGVERYNENKQIIRDYLSKHYDKLGDKQRDYLNYLTSWDSGDVAIEIGFSYKNILSGKELVTVDGESMITLDKLKEITDEAHNIGSYHLYGNLGDNPLVVDADGKNWYSLEYEGRKFDTDTLAQYAKENGYTSLVVKNVFDYGDKADDYIFFDPTQIKSADPVTYDDAGNVIPLSERFDFGKDDIRFREAVEEGGELKIIQDKQTDVRMAADYQTGERRPVVEDASTWRIEGMPGAYPSREEAIDAFREYAYGSIWDISDDGERIEVLGRGDMMAQMTGRTNKKDAARREKWAQERAKRAREVIDEQCERLGVQVHYVDDMSAEEREGLSAKQRRAKGWYDTRTGEVWINMGNHNSYNDIMATFLHEVVAHKGLRKLFGKDFDTFLDNVYANAEEGIRNEIARMAARNGWDFREATEEYLARLAESSELDNPDKRALLSWVKRAFMELLNKVGLRGLSLSDNDLRYVLWSSWHNMEQQGAIGAAEDVVMRDKLGLSNSQFTIHNAQSMHNGQSMHNAQFTMHNGNEAAEAQESGLRFSTVEDEAEEDYDAGPVTFEESVTGGLLKAASDNSAALSARVTAMRALGGNLSKLRRAMAQQRQYDRKTVDSIVRLAKQVLNSGFFKGLSRYEVNRLMGMINRAAGREDITKQAGEVVDMLLDHQMRECAEMLRKQISIRGSKINAKGVEVQGALDIEGQRMVQALKEGMEMTMEELDNRIGEVQDRMGSNDKVTADNAAIEMQGLLLAKQYLEDIKGSEAEERTLKQELKQAKEDKDSGVLGNDAYKQLVKEIEEALRENKLERTDAYARLMDNLGDGLKTSIERAKAWREANERRVQEIQHDANSDLQGMEVTELGKQPEKRGLRHNIVRLLMQPIATANEMFRDLGRKHVNGEGNLWKRFIGGWRAASDREFKKLKEAQDKLAEKVSAVMGKKMRWSDLFGMERKMEGMEVEMYDGKERKSFHLSQGNMLYIYMVNKMTDGKMKLRRMGITEDQVEAIAEKIDPRFKELADWIQEEFLVNKREEYNEVYERMFGAPMAAIENYFPLKINSRSRGQQEDTANYLDDENIGSTITGSVIKRVRNSAPLDITGTDAFDLVLEHLQQMEHWAAYAELNRDLGTLLSYKRFRNRLKQMKSVRFGTGEEYWQNFKVCCAILSGNYRARTRRNGADEAVTNIAKGITASKIAFRLYTAFKQLLSSPAYLSEASIGALLKNNPLTGAPKAWNWAIKELPGFAERWQSRISGDSRLMDTDSDWKWWHKGFVEKMNKWGMSPNAFVDAVTVCCGARAMYETKYKQYKKKGFSDEEAKKRALRDASISYNETQQSSEAAFVSAIQLDRTVASVALTVFRNCSMGYQRRLLRAMKNLQRRMQKGYKEESIEYMSKQLARELGIEDVTQLPAEAVEAVKKEYNRRVWRDMADVAIFGWVLQFAWNLGPYLVYLIGGDDDDDKLQMLEDSAIHALFGSVEGLAGGQTISDTAHKIVTDGMKSFSFGDINLLPMMSDLTNMLKHFKSDWAVGATDLVNFLIQSNVGVNPQTLSDFIVSIADACNGDMGVMNEAAFVAMRALQFPGSQLDKLFLDELGITKEGANGTDAQTLATRYAKYRKNKNAPLFGLFYSDEQKSNAMGKGESRFKSMIREKLGNLSEEDLLNWKSDDEYLNDIWENNVKKIVPDMSDEGLRKVMETSDNATVRSKVSNEIAKRVEPDDDKAKNPYGSNDAKYNQVYAAHQTWEDVAEDEILSYAIRRNKESDPALSKKLDSSRKRLTEIRKRLANGYDEEIMNAYREARRQVLEDNDLIK